jgi:hypothetical protein
MPDFIVSNYTGCYKKPFQYKEWHSYMAKKHTVTASVGNFELTKNTGKESGIMLNVHLEDGGKLGTLGLGYGSVTWWKKGKKGKPTLKLSWSEFADWINEKAESK